MQTDVPLEISVSEAKRLVDAGDKTVEVIDVREPFERDLCAIAGSTHIPMRQIPEHVPTLPKDKHLLIYCHHGGRSMRVTQFLRAQGFTRVTNVAGGIDAWAQEIEPGMRRY
jgi:rhodanese-related sulfurtransferase